MALTLTQTSFRLRNDDGDEAGASWKAAINTDATIPAHRQFRVRFLLTESGGTALSGGSLKIYYSLNGAAYAAAGAGTPVVAAGTKWLTHGADTTDQLAGSGTFTSNNNGVANDSLTATATISANEEAEVEYCIKLDPGGIDGIKDGSIIALRVYNNTTAIDTYTSTPTITVRMPGGMK